MRFRGVLFAISAVVSSCTSSSSSTSSSEPADPTKCGPGPYGTAIATIYEANTDGTGKPKPETTVTFDLCPTKTFTTGADGKATVQMTKNKPMIITIDHPDDIPTILPEWQLETDTFEGSAEIIPKLFRAAIAPEFNADNSVLGLGVDFPAGTFDGGVPDGGPTDPCQRREGVTFAITGHPEAKLTYFTTPPSGSMELPKPDPNATTTSEIGTAKVNGLPEDVFFEYSATKPGCTVNAKHDGFTGRAKLLKGFATLGFVKMTK